jgi:Dihydrodipicolinate synthetase family
LQEYGRLMRAVPEAASGRIPVIASCTAPSTSAAVELGREAASAGAYALLCAAPPYVKPTQQGIMAHIRAIAYAADIRVVLHDVPSRSGVAISDETVARLLNAELIIGLKDATDDLSLPPRPRARCGDAFMQWSGDDATAPAYRRWAALAAFRSPPTPHQRSVRSCNLSAPRRQPGAGAGLGRLRARCSGSIWLASLAGTHSCGCSSSCRSIRSRWMR